MMADITKCQDKDCPVKEQCYRWTAPDTAKWQPYFIKSPRTKNDCEMFWGGNAEQTFKQLKDIMR